METRGNLSYGQELLCRLAGPGANLLAAVLFGALDCDGLAGANAVLCLFNLLPVFPLDGGTVLYLLLSWLAGPQAAFWGSGVLAARRPPPFAALRYGSCGRRAGACGCCLRRWDCWRRQSAVSGRGEHFSEPVTFA